MYKDAMIATVCAKVCVINVPDLDVSPSGYGTLMTHIHTCSCNYGVLVHHAIQQLQVWSHLLVIYLNAPPRPTWGHFMPACDQARRPHFLESFSIKGSDEG